MKPKFLLPFFGLLGLLLGCLGTQAQVGPPNQIQCNKTAIMAPGPTVATQIVAPVTGQTVYVCGWHVTNTGATGTFSITTGTQTTTACDTGTVNITPTFNVTSTAPSSDHIDYSGISSKVSQGLCITPSVATIGGMVWYAQF